MKQSTERLLDAYFTIGVPAFGVVCILLAALSLHPTFQNVASIMRAFSMIYGLIYLGSVLARREMQKEKYRSQDEPEGL
jgi:hypothetical protein